MRRVHLGDVVAATTLTVFVVLISALDRTTQPVPHPMGGVGIALLVVSGMSLAARRAFPRAVFVISVAAAAAYIGLRLPGWPVYVVAFVALGGRGLSNEDIAEWLSISPATARTHVSRAMVKLRARDRAQLVCGEAAADPGLALVLAGLGVTSLSMAPTAVPEVRAALAAHIMTDCQELARVALADT
jgi:Bacterial regulatory proteins, luxR family/PEP-utilising enzyme, PEP-binding domain